ncbi:hypothetical protein Avbf_15928 [Armadillidium vulgare]|nr:hypothetical protein Avbf_15928 [Armadillidium vulgare]
MRFYRSCPNYFIWIQYISWFNYGFEALVILQWKDVKSIKCDQSTDEYCYNSGPQLIDELGFQEDGLWVDLLALIALSIFYRINYRYCNNMITYQTHWNGGVGEEMGLKA